MFIDNSIDIDLAFTAANNKIMENSKQLIATFILGWCVYSVTN